MRGGHNQVDEKDLKKIPELIESLGCVLISKHQTAKDAIRQEDQNDPAYIFERNLNWIKECDVVIAEISNASLGVGAEIAYSAMFSKPVLCVYKDTISEKEISALIRGMDSSPLSKTVSCKKYSGLEELKVLIKEFVR
jgi:nucleoside 2-deoxyribosyltransferase